jgi:hypothetical protein
MAALVTAVMRYIKLVKIDLEVNDNAQLIFETLNGRPARGCPVRHYIHQSTADPSRPFVPLIVALEGRYEIPNVGLE